MLNLIVVDFKKEKISIATEICEKTAIHGNKLSITRSHISKRAPRTWKPNLRTVKAEVDGEIKRIHVCAKCLKNGKVKRAQ